MQRQSNIELLRIISILMIVIHHVLVHGIYNAVNNSTLHFIDSFVIYGVNIFLLISGYFTINLKFSGYAVFGNCFICSMKRILSRYHIVFSNGLLNH